MKPFLHNFKTDHLLNCAKQSLKPAWVLPHSPETKLKKFSVIILYFFFFFLKVGPPNEDIIWATFYGLYFISSLHYINMTILITFNNAQTNEEL